MIDVFLQNRRDGKAAKRFFNRLLHAGGNEPRRIVTDKPRDYSVAHRALIPDTIHDTSQYANTRAKLSHQPTRICVLEMRHSHLAREFEENCSGPTFHLSVPSLPLFLLNSPRNLGGIRTFDAHRVDSGSREIIGGRTQLLDDVGRHARVVEHD